MSKYQTVIGRFEHIDVIDVSSGVPAKIDTGANRSAIHASSIRLIKKGDVELLEFQLLGHPAHTDSSVITTANFDQLVVMSSNGHQSTRYVVKLPVRLGFKIFKASFTLADRSRNVFPVLVGREALRKRFLVDPDRTGVNRAELKTALTKSHSNEELEGVNT